MDNSLELKASGPVALAFAMLSPGTRAAMMHRFALEIAEAANFTALARELRVSAVEETAAEWVQR